MGRKYDAILGVSYGAENTAPMVDLGVTGQHGHSDNLETYISNTLYVSKPVIAFLIDSPRGFRDLEHGDKLTAALKAFIETHSETIDGLNASISIDVADAPVGGSEEIQQDVVNVTRARSSPSHTVTERYGEAYTNFFLHGWIYPLIGDPETKIPGIAYSDVEVSDMLADYNSATVLYVEPDAAGRKVQKAFLITNMKPMSEFEITASRDKRGGGQTRQLSVEFTGIQQVGYGVNRFAQRMLDQLQLTGANPHYRKAFVEEISGDVEAVETGGYGDHVRRVSEENVKGV